MKNAVSQKSNSYDRLVFVGSIIGLTFLICTMLFRYYVLLPKQQSLQYQYRQVEQLKAEIRSLKAENTRLRSED